MQVGQIVSNVHRLCEVGWVLFLMCLGSISMAISEESTMPRRELSKSWHRRSRSWKLLSLSRANPARFIINFLRVTLVAAAAVQNDIIFLAYLPHRMLAFCWLHFTKEHKVEGLN